MVPNFKSLIKQYIKEYINQHPNFKDENLDFIGKNLIKKLQNADFLITKSDVSFSEKYLFDAKKMGKVYQVNIRKNSSSLNEDSEVDEVETFDRNKLKDLYPGVFKFKTNTIEYVIEFQDKAENGNIFISLKRSINPKKEDFQTFADEFTSEAVKQIVKKLYK